MVFLMHKINYWIESIFENMSRNDTNKGCIVASISKNDPPYYYHWTRDAGLVMLNLARIMLDKNSLFTDNIKIKFIEYLNFEYQCLSIKDQCISGSGEAKYCVNATPFSEPWGRPQNDGPAIRLLACLTIYKLFKKNGLESVIYNTLFGINNSIIVNDILYLLDNINESCYDLWEEVKGHHFYTFMVQYHSLIEAKCYFESSFNDFDKDFYENIKNDINDKIGFLDFKINSMISYDRVYSSIGDIENYNREWYDTSIFLAIMHTNDERYINNPIFLNSFYKMVMDFVDIYPINNNNNFFWMGRYKEDVYYGGNPWVLITVAFFEYIIRLRQLLISQEYVDIDPLNIRFFQLFYKDIELGKHNGKSTQFVNLIQSLLKYCKIGYDWVLGLEKSQAEQIDKFSGKYISAENLTWNYSQILSFLHQYNKMITI